MLVEKNVPLQDCNTFHIVAKAHTLVRVGSEGDLLALIGDPELAALPKFVLGGGSNIVLTGDVKPLVLKVEVMGKQLLHESAKGWVVEAGAGESWHGLVAWTLDQGYPGLENLAMIPGTVGAAPVQNIGAYGVELQDRFESLDALDLQTGRRMTLDAAQCRFGYRDSVFKQSPDDGPGLRDRVLITRVRFFLPKPWKPVLGYAELDRRKAPRGVGGCSVQPKVCLLMTKINKAPSPRLLTNPPAVPQNARAAPSHAATCAISRRDIPSARRVVSSARLSAKILAKVIPNPARATPTPIASSA